MEQQNDQSPSNGQTQLEDLTVNQDQAEEVKGGEVYLKIKLPDAIVSSYQSGG